LIGEQAGIKSLFTSPPWPLVTEIHTFSSSLTRFRLISLGTVLYPGIESFRSSVCNDFVCF